MADIIMPVGEENFEKIRTRGFYYIDKTKLIAELRDDTGFIDHASDLKRWYDGYHFGAYDIYCPWDVLNYVSDLAEDPTMAPASYWKDTSHNDVIRRFMGRDDLDVNEKLEQLLSGGSICVKIKEDMDYHLECATEDEFWSILYLTGYLTTVKPDKKKERGECCLSIPNEEVRTIFGDTIVEWFKEDIAGKAQEPDI